MIIEAIPKLVDVKNRKALQLCDQVLQTLSRVLAWECRDDLLRDLAGYVTSGAFGHCIGKSLAAGYVPLALARDGETFEIDILGNVCTAYVRLAPLYDPQGLRLRS